MLRSYVIQGEYYCLNLQQKINKNLKKYLLEASFATLQECLIQALKISNSEN